MAWVYILECRDGTFYVGSTTDLERRLWEHQQGLGATYTRRRRPVSLVWSVACERVDEAFAYEKQIQGWSRAKRRALIEGRTDDLPVLSSRSHRARQWRSAGGGFETVAERPPQPPEHAPQPPQPPEHAPRPPPPPDAPSGG